MMTTGNNMKDFIEHDGILWKADGRGGLPVMARGMKCPYCKKPHKHGTTDGHRLSHCGSNPAYTVRSPWGKWCGRGDGYYWIDADVNDVGLLFGKITDGLSINHK